MEWLKTSIMHTRGVAHGSVGTTHELTEARQGKYHFTIGPYTFRPAAKLLQEPVKNRRIRLTEKEAAILKFLYRAGTKSVARQVLLNEVWGYNAAVTTHTLETHIYRLRQKIEPDPANARLLVTEGGGYRLDPDGIAPTPPVAAAMAVHA